MASFTQQDYNKLLEEMLTLGEEKYREFNKSLVPGMGEAYGVRMPMMKNIAKNIAKADWEGYLALANDSVYEELLLQGLVIAKAKCDEATRMKYLGRFVPKINNWEICDTVCMDIKTAKKHRDEYAAFIAPYLASENEFEIRFGVVMLLTHYMDDEYIDNVLNTMQVLKHEGYYVKMAVAWALSVCFVKFRDKTFKVFEGEGLEKFTHNKGIQKCCESFRVSDEDKRLLRGMRK